MVRAPLGLVLGAATMLASGAPTSVHRFDTTMGQDRHLLA
jgi:hypothetical protein